MIHSRHPEVAATMVRCLSGPTDMRHFAAVASCRVELRALGCNIPEWEDLLTALPRALASLVPGVLAIPEEGWQHDTSSVLEQRFMETAVVTSSSPARRATFRSQGGPLSGSPVQGPPSSSPSPSSPTVLPRLPVWPSTRLLWPPPRKLLEDRGPWEAWLRIGVCSSACLPRGRR